MTSRNRLLAAMPPEIRRRFEPHLSYADLRLGDTIYDEDGRVDLVWFPSTAVLSAVTIMEDGSRIEIGTTGAENACGLLPMLAGIRSKAHVFAQVPGSAHSLPAGVLRETAEADPAFLRLLLRAVAAGQADAEQWAACNGLHGAYERLARWLLITEDRAGSTSYPITQDYLAVMVGVQRTTVTAAAQALRDRGLIDYKRGHMRILDRAGLERQACECHRAITRRYEELGIPQRAPRASLDAAAP
jgi:CRP-like cAMP-binding protein